MEIETKQLVMAVKQIAEEKNLPEDTVHDIIEQAIAAAWRRDFGDREMNVTSQINTNTGDVQITVHREIVEEVENEDMEISLDEAKKIRPDAAIGESIDRTEKPTSFGRVAAQTAKQVILQKLREAEREVVLEEYSDKIGTVVNGIVSRVEQRIVRVDLGRASGIMPKSEQIPGEYYSVGSRIKVFLKDVERGTRGPQLILSRATERFVELLFQNEVPEMENGAVEIKAISREPGVRTKLAVASTVPGVDPVGTFVGGHGTRVQAVMSEIGDQEKIDIITFDDKPETFIINALSPTEVAKVEVDKTNQKAVVKVNDDQLSIAIGKGGQNVRLASKLTGFEIDIVSVDGSPVTSQQPADSVKNEAEAKPAAAKAKARPRRNIEDSLLAAIESQADDADSGDDDGNAETEATPKEKLEEPESTSPESDNTAVESKDTKKSD